MDTKSLSSYIGKDLVSRLSSVGSEARNNSVSSLSLTFSILPCKRDASRYSCKFLLQEVKFSHNCRRARVNTR